MITFVNVFTVVPEKQQLAYQKIQQVYTEVVQYQPGFLGARLLLSHDRVRVTAIAEWETEGHLQALRQTAEFKALHDDAFQETIVSLDAHVYETAIAVLPSPKPPTVEDSPVLQALQQASAGLLFTSESDHPFTQVFWRSQSLANLSNQQLLQLTGHASDTPVAISDLDSLFQGAIQCQEWHGEEERHMVQGFQELVQILKANLQEIRVYRVGTIVIDVYILGQTPDGHIAGLSTKVVET